MQIPTGLTASWNAMKARQIVHISQNKLIDNKLLQQLHRFLAYKLYKQFLESTAAFGGHL